MTFVRAAVLSRTWQPVADRNCRVPVSTEPLSMSCRPVTGSYPGRVTDLVGAAPLADAGQALRRPIFFRPLGG